MSDLTLHRDKEIFSRFCGVISGDLLNSNLSSFEGQKRFCKLDPWLGIEETTLDLLANFFNT